MKDFIFPSSILAYLAQTAPVAADWPALVKEFGTWIIWLAIAIYLYKRGEKRDDEDRVERKKSDEERLNVQNQILSAIKDQAQHTHTLTKRFKGKPCFSDDEITD